MRPLLIFLGIFVILQAIVIAFFLGVFPFLPEASQETISDAVIAWDSTISPWMDIALRTATTLYIGTLAFSLIFMGLLKGLLHSMRPRLSTVPFGRILGLAAALALSAIASFAIATSAPVQFMVDWIVKFILV